MIPDWCKAPNLTALEYCCNVTRGFMEHGMCNNTTAPAMHGCYNQQTNFTAAVGSPLACYRNSNAPRSWKINVGLGVVGLFLLVVTVA